MSDLLILFYETVIKLFRHESVLNFESYWIDILRLAKQIILFFNSLNFWLVEMIGR